MLTTKRPRFKFVAVFLTLFLIAVWALPTGWHQPDFKFETIKLKHWPSPPSAEQDKEGKSTQKSIADTPNAPTTLSQIPLATPVIPQTTQQTAPSALSPSATAVKVIPPISQLTYLCQQTEWTPGLWVHCHSGLPPDQEGKFTAGGGLNNIRNRLQTCLRVAIDAGAGVVIPWITVRNSKTYSEIPDEEPIPASTFWDMEYMQTALKNECPQLQVRLDIKGLNASLIDAQKKRKQKYATGLFKSMAVNVLKGENISLEAISPTNPRILSFWGTWSFSLHFLP